MSFFGRGRDVAFVHSINRELIGQVQEQYVGYYKIDLTKTTVNIYGESLNKGFNDPVLTPARIEIGDYSTTTDDAGSTRQRILVIHFFKPHLIERGVVPEIGDILLWNEEFYEVDNVNENQFIVGKDPNYHYKDGDGVEDSGNSLSITLTTHYTNPERLGLKEERI